jgi:excisionase family DNA binding protein
METILTIPEVAKYLKLSKSKVYYLVKRNELPHIRIGRNVRVLETDLLVWIQKKRNSPSQLVFLIDNLQEKGFA